MSKILSTTAIAIGIGAAAFGMSAIGPVSAQTADPSTSSSAPATTDGSAAARHRHPRLRARLIRNEARIAADTIGVSVADLRDAVCNGESVADVATAHGVNPDDVTTAIVDDVTAKIDTALSNGKLSPENAAKLKERLPNAVDRFMNFTRGQ